MITAKMVFDALLKELGHPSAYIYCDPKNEQEKNFTCVCVDGYVDCQEIADSLNKIKSPVEELQDLNIPRTKGNWEP
jgi:hypothetical protein